MMKEGGGAIRASHGVPARGPVKGNMAVTKGFTTRPELIKAVRDSGNDAAWREFLALYQPMISRWCERSGLGQGDAEDVCADVVAKLADVMRSFTYNPRWRFRGWLKTVVKHAVVDFWRRRPPPMISLGDPTAREIVDRSAIASDFGEVAGDLAEDVERAIEVAEIVRRKVQQDAWQVYWLTAVEGEKARDVAARLKMSVAAVYTCKCRVKKLVEEEAQKATTRHRVVDGDGALS
jgi:RNA polymerase sigma-70 factor (ECF subfamily)